MVLWSFGPNLQDEGGTQNQSLCAHTEARDWEVYESVGLDREHITGSKCATRVHIYSIESYHSREKKKIHREEGSNSNAGISTKEFKIIYRKKTKRSLMIDLGEEA